MGHAFTLVICSSRLAGALAGLVLHREPTAMWGMYVGAGVRADLAYRHPGNKKAAIVADGRF